MKMHCSRVFFYLEKYSLQHFWTIVQFHLFQRNETSGISIFCTSVSSNLMSKQLPDWGKQKQRKYAHHSKAASALYINLFLKRQSHQKRAGSLALLTRPPYTSSFAFSPGNAVTQSERHRGTFDLTVFNQGNQQGLLCLEASGV